MKTNSILIRNLSIIGSIIVLALVVGFFLAKGGDPYVQARCLSVPAEEVERIESGLIADDLFLENVQAVRSNDFEKVYFISAYIKGGSLSGDSIATFATNSLNESSLIFSVSEIAKGFAVWPEGDLTMNDDGVFESRNCVSQSL